VSAGVQQQRRGQTTAEITASKCLCRALYYHHERNHQGVDNRLLIGTTAIRTAAGPVRKRERLGASLIITTVRRRDFDFLDI
jgi:hypothetical protein